MERVLVVRRADFFDATWPQGFVAAATNLVDRLAAQAFYVDRATAENEPALKQLIPYCVVRREHAVLCVRRLRAQTEARLHGRYSIGIGGHVNPADGEGPAALARARARELDEELAWPADSSRDGTFLGLLNDDRTPVGQVHAGLVYEIRVPTGTPVSVRETAKMRGRFRSWPTLTRLRRRDRGAASLTSPVVETPPVWQDSGAFETWSAMLLDACPWDVARTGLA